MYEGACVGIHLVGLPRKRWIYIVNDCLTKEVWVLGKQREWCMIAVNGEELGGGMFGVSQGDEPPTFTRCYSCGLA